MVKAEKNGEYTAARVRSGSSDRGDWELIAIKDEGKGRQELTIFPNSVPSGVVEGGTFSINEITLVTVKAAKDKNGSWATGRTQTTIEADVAPTSSGMSSGFDFGDDDDLVL